MATAAIAPKGPKSVIQECLIHSMSILSNKSILNIRYQPPLLLRIVPIKGPIERKSHKEITTTNLPNSPILTLKQFE